MSETIVEDFERNYGKKVKGYPYWVIGIGDPRRDRPFGFQCLHCGQIEDLPRDITLNDYCHRAAAFAKAHRECKPK